MRRRAPGRDRRMLPARRTHARSVAGGGLARSTTTGRSRAVAGRGHRAAAHGRRALRGRHHPGARAGGDRRGQGRALVDDSPAVTARRAAVRVHQLRRAARDAPRERAVRPRARRLHRRDGRPARDCSRAPAAAPCSSTRWPSSAGGAGHAAARARSGRGAAPGRDAPRPIDVRFIAATNRDLEHEVERGRFRQDLYFRLAAATIVIPPLRERIAEIRPLARVFARRACRELGRTRVPRIVPEATDRAGVPRVARQRARAPQRGRAGGAPRRQRGHRSGPAAAGEISGPKAADAGAAPPSLARLGAAPRQHSPPTD